jgi:hypothetical protein
MATWIETLIGEFIESADIDPAVARDWYQAGAQENRRIAQLALPELPDPDQYTLYATVSSILSNGKTVVRVATRSLRPKPTFVVLSDLVAQPPLKVASSSSRCGPWVTSGEGGSGRGPRSLQRAVRGPIVGR